MPPRKQLLATAALIALSGVVLWWLLVRFPPLLVPAGKLDVSERARLLSESAIRSTVLQLIGGLVVIFGIVYTAAQFRVSRETHYTDRYTKAIDQLGHAEAVVRMGGIFALHRLALNSKIDRPTVTQVLNGYLRSIAALPPGSGVPPVSTAKTHLDSDVQAALAVLVELHAPAA
jgi:hypothetical protein